jgi:hypothetical protein
MIVQPRRCRSNLLPPPANPNPNGGDATTPKAPNYASSLLRGASEAVAVAAAAEDALITALTKAMAASAAADGAEAVTSA